MSLGEACAKWRDARYFGIDNSLRTRGEYRALMLTVRLAEPFAYHVTALMEGRRVMLVVSGGADPYTTEDREQAERVLASVSDLAPAYRDARIEFAPRKAEDAQ